MGAALLQGVRSRDQPVISADISTAAARLSRASRPLPAAHEKLTAPALILDIEAGTWRAT